MRVTDDTTYDYGTAAIELGETQILVIPPRQREQAAPACRNASFPLNGGNRNCSVYQALQCLSDICIFNYSIGMSSPNNIRTSPLVDGRTPILLAPSSTPSQLDVLNRTTIRYYFLPFTRSSAVDSAFLLSKVNGDSFFFGRIIANAFTPF